LIALGIVWLAWVKDRLTLLKLAVQIVGERAVPSLSDNQLRRDISASIRAALELPANGTVGEVGVVDIDVVRRRIVGDGLRLCQVDNAA
jgi:hypothetical protein